MNRKYTDEAIRLTQQLLQDYYRKNPETVLSLCAEDMTWIGAQAEQYVIGLNAFKNNILAITEEMFRCKLLQQEFMITQNLGNVCTVIGRYLVESDDENFSAASMQRCVVVWEKIGDDLKIKHLSTFNPLETMIVADGEKFVNKTGQYIKKYIEQKTKTANNTTVGICDYRNVTHFIPLCDIMWAESRGRDCIVHTTSKDVQAKMSLTDFAKLTNDDFMWVHRCYIINVHCIKEIKPFCITLMDETELGIPKRRYAEIKEELIRKIT